MDSFVLISAGISGIWSFKTLVPLGMEEQNGAVKGIRYTVSREGIRILERGFYEIYGVGGRRIERGYSDGDVRIRLKRGVYILRMGGTGVKFVIP